MQKKWGKIIAALLAFAIAGTLYCVEVYEKEAPVWENTEETGLLRETEALEKPETGQKQAETVTTRATIYVHICGEVQHPGVYEVPEGCRLYELLALAGGSSDNGCADALNLAETLKDGQRVVIPTLEEAETMQEATAQTTQGLVNLNTASVQELMTLPGIGEAKATDIIQYRETQGKFQMIEDIMKISGIKDALFQKIKDRITV